MLDCLEEQRNSVLFSSLKLKKKMEKMMSIKKRQTDAAVENVDEKNK